MYMSLQFPVVETLEDRRLLSAAMIANAAATPTALLHGVAAIGDSQTDEYRTHDILRSKSRAAVEVLADLRMLPVGSWTDGDRGTPRHAGYAFNWARDGATTTDMLTEGQDAGVVTQVQAGQVSLAYMFIGLNDVAAITQSSNPLSAITGFASKSINNIKTAVNRILASSRDMKVAVATLPDVTYMPMVKTMIDSGTFPSIAVQFLRSMQADLNKQIADLGKNSRVAVMDLAGLFSRMNANSTYQVGNITLSRYSAGAAPTNMYVLDGIHFNTVTQGLIANEFITAINAKFAANLQPLGGQEIVDYAQRIYGGLPGTNSPVYMPNLFSNQRISLVMGTMKKYLSPVYRADLPPVIESAGASQASAVQSLAAAAPSQLTDLFGDQKIGLSTDTLKQYLSVLFG